MRAGALSWQASRRLPLESFGVSDAGKRRLSPQPLEPIRFLQSCCSNELWYGRHVAISTGEGWKRAPNYPVCFKCTDMDRLLYQLYWWSRKQQVIIELQNDLIFEPFISVLTYRLYIKDGSSNCDVTLWIWESSHVKHFHRGVLKHARRLEALPSVTHPPVQVPGSMSASVFTF